MSRIGLIGENSIEYVSSLIDIWNKGNSAVLIDWRIPADSVVVMLQEAGVEVCVIDVRYLERFDDKQRKCISFRPYTVTETLPQQLPEKIYDKFIPWYLESEAVVLYSSGTTGNSKGIILSHYAINTNADAIANYMKLGREDCIYVVKSLTHSSTLVGELLVALKTHTALLIANTVMPPRVVFRNITTFGITVLCVNPTLLQMYIEESIRTGDRCPSLKTIFVSGSALPNALCEKVRDVYAGTELYNIYGLTEAGPRVTAQRQGCCHGNSVGKPIEGVEIAVIKKQGEFAEKNEKGIIHVKTPSRYGGYIRGEEKQSSLYRDWLNTGDIGFIDDYGELHISGRADDMIMIDAHKIYPVEVEQYICQLPGVKECVVLGIFENQRNILGCLYTGECELSLVDRKTLQRGLCSYEIRRFWLKCESIPKTRNGKISRTTALQVLLEKFRKGNEDDAEDKRTGN